MTMTVFDTETFEKLKARMKAKFPILLDGYLRDARKYLSIIEDNLPAGNLVEIINAAHSLKSASGLLGAVEVQERAAGVEYGGKDLQQSGGQDCRSLQPHFEALRDRFAAVEPRLIIELEKARAG